MKDGLGNDFTVIGLSATRYVLKSRRVVYYSGLYFFSLWAATKSHMGPTPLTKSSRLVSSGSFHDAHLVTSTSRRPPPVRANSLTEALHHPPSTPHELSCPIPERGRVFTSTPDAGVVVPFDQSCVGAKECGSPGAYWCVAKGECFAIRSPAPHKRRRIPHLCGRDSLHHLLSRI